MPAAICKTSRGDKARLVLGDSPAWQIVRLWFSCKGILFEQAMKEMKCDLSDDGMSHFYWSEVTFFSTKGHLRFAMPSKLDFTGKTVVFIIFHLQKQQKCRKIEKSSRNICTVREKAVPLHSQLGNHSSFAGKQAFWRDGRVVDCIGLENRRTERYRGFESLSLR